MTAEDANDAGAQPESQETEPNADVEKCRLNIAILSEVDVSQRNNGVCERNYLRYRQYCSRRLRRLRKSVRFMHGRGKFVKKTVTSDIVSSERHLLLPLYNAERAWAYAMQLKQGLDTSSVRSRQHLQRRLAKATLWAKKLHALCIETADTRTALEAEAYSVGLRAQLCLEKEELGPALHWFGLASKLYSSLAGVVEAEQRALCLQRVEALEPSMRYCSYILQKQQQKQQQQQQQQQLDITHTDNVDELLRSKLERVLSEARVSEASALDTVDWLGESLPLRSEELRLALLQADQDSQQHSFGDAFEHFDQAKALIQTELNKLAGMKPRSARIENEEKQLASLQDYVSFHKLRLLLSRNEMLAADLMSAYTTGAKGGSGGGGGRKKVRPDDLIVMFEKCVLNMNELLELGGASQGSDLSKEAHARILAFNAFRDFYCSEFFAGSGRWLEANAFLSRCVNRCQQAMDATSAWNPSASLSQLEGLLELAKRGRMLVRARGALQKYEEDSGGAVDDAVCGESDLLMSRLNRFESGAASHHHSLVEFPPAFSSTVCKAVLFDLAWDGIEYPDLSARAQASSRSQWGLLGRLWG